MKSLAAIALATTVAAQGMTEYDSLFRQFGNCQGDEWGSTAGCEEIGKANAQCCKFEVSNDRNIKG